MEVKLLARDKEAGKLSFLLKGGSAWWANTLRRMIAEEVPTMAIEDVEFRDNSSALYDEIIAHRLGLIPFKTDLKSYCLPEECACKGKGCSRCQLKMTLKAKGLAAGTIVYASDIKSRDPKVKSVFPKMPIVKLLKGQKLELEARAILGKGKMHAKWAPGLVWYRGWPEFEITKKSDLKACGEQCPLLEIRGKTLKIKDISKWNEACEEICEKNRVIITNSNTDFIFNIESWGQLDTRDIVKYAVKLFQQKLDEFNSALIKKKKK